MIKREKPVISTFSNLATSFITIGIGIITGIIVTRSLGPELKGEYTNIKLITTLYAPFLLFGYQGGVLYFGLKKQINIKEFFWIGWIFTGVISSVIALVFYPLALNGYLGSVASNSKNIDIILGLLNIPILLLNGYCNRVLRTFHLFIASNIRIIVGASITLVYYIILLIAYEINLSNALFGLIIGQTVQLLMNLYFIIKYIRIKWTLDLKNILKPYNYGVKVWFNQLIAQSNDKFDITILSFLLNAGSLGVYSVGVGLSNLVTMLPSSYLSVFFTQITEKNRLEAIELYAKAQRITFIITVIISFFLSLLAFPLIYLMYGQPFISAAWVVIFYTPGLIFQVAARLSIKFYAGQGRPLKNSLVYIVGLIVSLPFYFILIPKLGIKGAAIASSIAYLSAFLFSFYQIHREYGLSILEIIKFKSEDIMYIRSHIGNLPVIGKYYRNK